MCLGCCWEDLDAHDLIGSYLARFGGFRRWENIEFLNDLLKKIQIKNSKKTQDSEGKK